MWSDCRQTPPNDCTCYSIDCQGWIFGLVRILKFGKNYRSRNNSAGDVIYNLFCNIRPGFAKPKSLPVRITIFKCLQPIGYVCDFVPNGLGVCRLSLLGKGLVQCYGACSCTWIQQNGCAGNQHEVMDLFRQCISTCLGIGPRVNNRI